jgi:hypothetical protein
LPGIAESSRMASVPAFRKPTFSYSWMSMRSSRGSATIRSSRASSNISDDAHYDQMALFPGPIEDAISATGVFDFDGAVFRDLWATGRRPRPASSAVT